MSGKPHGGGGGKKRRGGHEEHEEHENHERWLLTYADMITLLMVLFIVLFAISQVDQAKFMALKTGLASGFGAPVAMMPGGDAMLEPGGAVAPDSVNLAGNAGQKNGRQQLDPSRFNVNPEAVAELAKATSKAQAAKELKNLQEARKELQKALDKAGLPKSATFRFDERGLVVTIATDDVLFDSGSATLLPKGRTILDTLAPTLRKVPNRLSVDGHTNSLPISSDRFPSNWELSTDRATGVLRYLNSRHKIAATKMSASGFADTKPMLAGRSARALKLNRRVEIVVLATFDNPLARSLASEANAAEAAAAKAALTKKAATAAAADAAAASRIAAEKAAAAAKAQQELDAAKDTDGGATGQTDAAHSSDASHTSSTPHTTSATSGAESGH